MNIRSFGSLVLTVLLLLSLASCRKAEPVDDKTTAATTSTTTMTAATNTMTTKTTKSGSITTVNDSTTVTTASPSDKNTPYEAPDCAPGKNKRCFLFTLDGEEMKFTFETAMVYPEYSDYVLWHYTGTTKSGASYTCKVAAEHNQIFEIDCEKECDSVIIKEEDARACAKRFLTEQKIPIDTDKINLQKEVYSMRGSPPQSVVYWSLHLPMKQENDYFSVSFRSRNGAVYVDLIRANRSGIDNGQAWSLPYCLQNDYDILTPRWENK